VDVFGQCGEKGAEVEELMLDAHQERYKEPCAAVAVGSLFGEGAGQPDEELSSSTVP
jgi:hypothetical protein